jgi:glutathione synthase
MRMYGVDPASQIRPSWVGTQMFGFPLVPVASQYPWCSAAWFERTAADGGIDAFIDEHKDTILKPLDGMGGTSIFRVRADDANRNVIVETVGQHGARTAMVQKFIPEIADGDKRVLLIAGEPVPFALARIPKAGETRGNLAVGGRGVARPLTARDRAIAVALGPRLWAEGLLVVGLDVIGDYLTEVNVTSPTCFVEISQQSGFDVGAMFAAALEKATA